MAGPNAHDRRHCFRRHGGALFLALAFFCRLWRPSWQAWPSSWSLPLFWADLLPPAFFLTAFSRPSWRAFFFAFFAFLAFFPFAAMIILSIFVGPACGRGNAQKAYASLSIQASRQCRTGESFLKKGVLGWRQTCIWKTSSQARASLSGSHLVTVKHQRRFARQFDPQPFHLDEAAAQKSSSAGWLLFGLAHCRHHHEASGGSGMRLSGGLIGAGGELTLAQANAAGRRADGRQ